jgi:diaminohydroxyphosphoribosylaminopyrimidine deaminase / 5-amino-6-(5-phosphoribosylamino)uracil reductase
MNGGLTAALAALDERRDGHKLVIAQLGQSLDGRIATPTGASKYINGPVALDFLHHLRALVDAVVVGVGTVIADDPLLTVRRVPGRSPVRVVIDPKGRMPLGAKCLSCDAARTYVIRHTENCEYSHREPSPCEALEVPAIGEDIDPRAIIAALAARGMRRVLIEGGATTVSRFIAAGAVDRLYVLVAPMLLGSGRPGLELPPIDQLSEALRPAVRSYSLEGGDVLFDCRLESKRGGENEQRDQRRNTRPA